MGTDVVVVHSPITKQQAQAQAQAHSDDQHNDEVVGIVGCVGLVHEGFNAAGAADMLAVLAKELAK